MPDNWLLEAPSMIINPYRFVSATNPGTDELLAYYSLEDNTDSHGGPDLTGGTEPDYTATGIIGNAADFDNANDEYLSLSSAALSSLPSGEFSVSVWVNPDTKTTDMGFVNAWGTTTGEQNWLITYSTTLAKWRFAMRDTGGALYIIGSDSDAVTGDWTHIVCTFDASKVMRMYVNGTLQSDTDTVTNTPNTTTTSFQIGRFGNFDTVDFDGRIDEVAIWDDKTLTQSEVNYLFNSEAGRSYADL